MARPSKLTPEQWEDAVRRVLIDNEPVRLVAREFGVDEAALRRRINPHKSAEAITPLRTLAEKKVKAEREMKEVSNEIEALPFIKRQIVTDLATSLRNISEHAASAAEYGMMTAHKLNAIAHAQSERIDETAPLHDTKDENGQPIAGNAEAVRSVIVMTEAANKAATIGLNLLAANKDRFKPGDEQDRAPSGLGHFYGEDDPADT